MSSKVVKALCEQCPLRERPLVCGKGPLPEQARAVILGEAPGFDEAREGSPFVGKSGKLLRNALNWAKIDPDTVYFTNVVKCHPPKNQLPPSAITCCKPALRNELQVYVAAKKPIMAVGGVATEVLLGRRMKQSKWYRDGRVLVTWHPAFVLRVPDMLYPFLFDCRRLSQGGPYQLPNVYYRVASSIKEIVEYIGRLMTEYEGKTVCYDLETDQVMWWKHEVLCMAFAHEPDKAFVIPRKFIYAEEVADVLEELFDSQVEFVGHNVKFDIKFLSEQLGVQNARANYDSLIAHYALYENSLHGLKPLLAAWYNVPNYEKQYVKPHLKNSKDYYSKVPPQELMHYNALDVCYNLMLWRDLRAELEEDGLWEKPYLYPLMAVQPTLADMERRGVLVDPQQLTALSDQIAQELARMQNVLETACGRSFNPRSPKQVSPIIYDFFGLPRIKGRTFKAGSTAEGARTALLEKMPKDHPAYNWLIMYGDVRSLNKLKSSYVDNMHAHLDANNRVHPDFLVYGTETGRMSARTPPIHSIPKPGTNREGEPDWGKAIRSSFVAPPGFVMLMADYSQAEMRVGAGMSNEPFLLSAYLADLDLHGEVAKVLYREDFSKRERQICKSFNFAFFYGGTEYSFAADNGMKMEEARAFVRRYTKAMPVLVAWKAQQLVTLRRQGYVEIPTGHRRRFPLITNTNIKDAKKSAVNAPVQGMAGQLTIIALMELAEWCYATYPGKVYPNITVHDSIVFEVSKELVDIVACKARDVMEEVGSRYYPQLPWKVDIEVGAAWGGLESYEPIAA